MTDAMKGVGHVLDRLERIEIVRQQTITAIALKRFELKNGKHPSNLSELVPEFLPAVPPDPVDGKAMRYQCRADGTFLLYSVGEDGKDDGGDPHSALPGTSLNLQRGRDYVWPSPATEEEIENFEKSPSAKKF